MDGRAQTARLISGVELSGSCEVVIFGTSGFGTTGFGGPARIHSEIVAVAEAASPAQIVPLAAVSTTASLTVATLELAGTLSIEVIERAPSIDDQVEVRVRRRVRATVDDYALVMVPIAIGLGAFGVVTAFANPVSGAIWGVAFVIITTIAMHDDEFSKLVARWAKYLRGE